MHGISIDMSIDEVMELESAREIDGIPLGEPEISEFGGDEELASVHATLKYKGLKYGTRDVDLSYTFIDDKLFDCSYDFEYIYPDEFDSYKLVYDELVAQFTDDYGEPESVSELQKDTDSDYAARASSSWYFKNGAVGIHLSIYEFTKGKPSHSVYISIFPWSEGVNR
jgi:hypothetical protein